MSNITKVSLMGILICFISILGIGNAKAEAKDVSWTDIQNYTKRVINNTATVTTGENTITISVNIVKLILVK